jgi:hypothetical protein
MRYQNSTVFVKNRFGAPAFLKRSAQGVCINRRLAGEAKGI